MFNSEFATGFKAVDDALLELREIAFDGLLMIGVAGKTSVFRLEAVAHNWIGATPDVRGIVAGPGPIDPGEGPSEHPDQRHRAARSDLAQSRRAERSDRRRARQVARTGSRRFLRRPRSMSCWSMAARA